MMEKSETPICLSSSWKQTLEQQWFQIALKTYFWAGFLFACVFATSLACMVGTKYYYDQTVLRHNAMERDFRSYSSDLSKARETLREAGKVWYAVDQVRKEVEASNSK